MKKGIIVSFEGIDGCGKTTQAKLFYNYLREKKIDCIYLYEPGSTEIGEKIRNLLLDSKKFIYHWCELFLYLASRAQLVYEKIKKEVESGKVVILDRYIHSTIAYQGYGRGLSIKLIERIHKEFIGEFFPDITFIIDENPENLIQFLEKKKKDRIENESIEFQKRVREGYMKIAKKEEKVKIIKRKAIEETFKEIIDEWEKFLNESRRSKKNNKKSKRKR